MVRHPKVNRYGQHQSSTIETMGMCPHCGEHLELFEMRDEWDEVRKVHGVGVGPLFCPPGATIEGWWFCHRCEQGGAVLWEKAEVNRG
jgi:hypothetical protein